jgi:hypothetical protein
LWVIVTLSRVAHIQKQFEHCSKVIDEARIRAD